MLSINQLTKSYGDLQVLKGVSLDVEKGEVIALIGPSGSGKSTLLRCINRMETPTSGAVYFGDQVFAGDKIDQKTLNRLRSKIGMVFQHFNLFPHLTVLENITLAPIKLHYQDEQAANNQAQSLLDKVGLGDKGQAYPHQLSGGQKQRVAIARALALKPEILLFDEPTSALDPERVKEVLNVIQDLALEGMTLIIVTHEMSFAQKVASRVAFMDQGQILEIGSADQVFQHPQSDRLQTFLKQVDF
ncbi:amino acid ABC transporter ATP-binding protein [Facklamia languida]